MNINLKIILTVASIAALAGCSKETSFSQSFFNQAGDDIDEGAFGNPTMNNQLVQTGQRSYTVGLAKKFAAEVPATVNFAFNSSQLDETAKEALRQQAAWIRQFPEVKFRVYGHTDLVGGNTSNKRLGLRRARTVVSYLVNQGISRNRLAAVTSHGEAQPVVTTEGKERRNRRTVTEVSGLLKTHPMVLHGKYGQAIFEGYVGSAAEAPSVAVVKP